MGLLDIFLNDGSPYSVENGVTNDLVTQYDSSWLSGTPTATSNPGPIHNFIQEYSPDIQYANNIGPYNSPLEGTNPITNLDVEDPGVAGGPNADNVTVYPPTVTGTPTSTANPGGPPVNFSQPNLPTNTYIDNVGSGELVSTLPITNLDVEDPGVQGGPNADITTQYPSNVTGVPYGAANWSINYPFVSGAPPANFSQPNLPTNTYIDNVGPSTSPLETTLPVTNLDIEDSGVLGGPNVDRTTVYPPTVTGTPNSNTNWSLTAPYVSGAPPLNFRPQWKSNLTYLSRNPVASLLSGKLINTFKITNYDIEANGVLGGPNADTTTSYPPNVTGTPTPDANPGAPPVNFSQPNTPGNTYLDNLIIPNIHSYPGKLSQTLFITNLDVLEEGVQGGIPYKPLNDPTVYPSTTNASSPLRGYFPTPGKPAVKYGTSGSNHTYEAYSPGNTYTNYIEAFI